jgi:hypothetical protein
MAHRGYADGSRLNWGADESERLTLEQINTGAILRIAKATETMAASYDRMREDRDYWKRRYEQEQASAIQMTFTIRALRGTITRMKRGAK